MSADTNTAYVMDFFKSWEKGAFSDLEASYRQYLDPNVLYENPGVPACNGIEESVALIRSVCLLPALDIQTIYVDVRHIAAVGDLVFTERVDSHRNTEGKETLVPAICGVMEFKNGKIVRWADYFDPGPMVAGI